MGAYFIRRILIAIPVLLGITMARLHRAVRSRPATRSWRGIDPEILSRMTPGASIEARRQRARARPADPDPLPALAGRTSSRATSATPSSTGGPIADEVGGRLGPTLLLMLRRGRDRDPRRVACRRARPRSTSTATSTTCCRRLDDLPRQHPDLRARSRRRLPLRGDAEGPPGGRAVHVRQGGRHRRPGRPTSCCPR